MAREGQTFRVFVSSTFSDLKAERDALQAEVFPRLRELCERRGARFQAIDLRWGVSQQASQDQQTMSICLSEIARCQEVTPKPNFIVLLGDRYGWCPPPPQIPAKEFDRILAALETEDQRTSSEQRLLLWEEDGGEPDDGIEMVQWDDEKQAFVGDKGWYRRDENAKPDEYVLQPWDGFTYDEWSEIEEDLHAALEKGARAAGLDDGALFKYWASATHQEIAAGAMSVPDADEHVFAFFRHIDDPPKNEEAEGFIDLVEAEEGIRPDADAKERLVELKAELRSTLGEGNVEEYDEVEWTDEGPSTDHIDQLCDDVYQALKGVIENQLADLEQIDPLEAETAAHQAFGEERAEFFTGRAAYLEQIADYLTDASSHPLAVWGESGSGKSALLAKAVEETQEAHPEAELIYRFIGATPESSSGRALLEGLCRQISRRYGADESDIPSEYKDLAQEFPKHLALATAERPLILFIDALNQLSDMDNAKALTWLPAELPENVRLVVSTVPGDCRDVLERKLPPEGLLQLEPMPEDEAEELLNLWLKDADRELQAEQRRDVLTNPKPLYLKLAFEEARRWHSYDGLPRGTDGVPGLSDDIDGVIGDLFARLSSKANHGEMLVSRSLGYLAAAKNGLTEDELLDVLARDVDVYAWFLSTLFHTPPDLMRAAQAHLRRERKEPAGEEAAEDWLKKLREGEDEKRLRDFLSAVLREGDGLRLPVVLWSRLYADLKPYLTQQSADGTSLLSFYHPTTFGRAVKAEYLSEDVRHTRHRALASYYDAQPLIRADGGEQRANLRKLSELPYQQAHGHQWDQVKTTLTDFDFLQAKVSSVGPQPLIEDFDLALAAGHEGRDLALVQGALQLSAHILVRDEAQLAGQLVGRLLAHEAPGIQGLVEQAKGCKRPPWLRPLSRTLTQAGSPLLRTLEGHTKSVRAVAVTPDGTRAVSGSRDNTLKVWDLGGGTEVHTLEGHRGNVTAVAVTSDGRQAISASEDKTLKVWDLESGQALRTLEGHTHWVNAVAVTPDGTRAVSGSRDTTLKVWDLESGQKLGTLEGHTGWVRAVAVTPDGKCVLSGLDNGNVSLWVLKTGELVRTLTPPEGQNCWVQALGVIPGDHCAVISFGKSSLGGSLKVWDFQSGEILHTIEGGSSEIEALAVTPDGTRVVSASRRWNFGNDRIRVWDLDSGEELNALRGHSDCINAVAVTPDGTRVVSGSDDGTVKVWNIENAKKPRARERHANSVRSLMASADGRRAISLSRNHALGSHLKTWDMQTGQELCTIGGLSRFAWDAAVTPDGRRAIGGPSNKSLKVWDLESGEEVLTMRERTPTVGPLTLTPDGNCVVSVSRKLVHLWDLETGEVLRVLDGYEEHKFGIDEVAVTSDGRWVVTREKLGPLNVWDLEKAELVGTLEGHTGRVNAVALTPDNTHAVSASHDETLMVWDLKNGAVLHTLKGHRREVSGVMITPNGRFALSSSRDNTLRMWDLQIGEEVQSLSHPATSSMKVTADGRRAVSNAYGSTLTVLDLRNGEEIARLTVESHISAYEVAPSQLTLVVGDGVGLVHFLHLENVTFGPAVVTGGRVWRYGRNGDAGGWQETIEAACPWCGQRFPVASEILDVITGITADANLPPDRSPCLQLPKEAWDEPGLLSECPHCHRPLKFNPFVVGPSQTPSAQGAAPAREEAGVEPSKADALDTMESASTPSRSGMVDAAAPEHLKPGARLLWDKMLDTPDRYGHSEPGLNHFLLALLERHGAMVESLVPDLGASDYRRQLEQRLQEGETGAPVEPEALLGEALARAREEGKEEASERDLAVVLLKRAGPFPPAQAEEPAASRSQPRPQPVPTETPTPPPLPISFAAEQLIQSALRQHDGGESGELDMDQWLATLLDEHRGLAEDAAEGRDLDALRSALHHEVEQGTVPRDLSTDVLVDRASERARAAGQQVLRPQDMAAAILTAALRTTSESAEDNVSAEARGDVPRLPLSFGAEQMIQAALRFHDAPETSELGANQWLGALLAKHRELVEDIAGTRGLKELEARARRQLDCGEIGAPLARGTLIARASQRAEQMSRQVVTPRDLATVILAADPDTSRLMHRG